MVVTRYRTLPKGTEKVDTDKFYTGDYPFTERIRSVMDNSIPANDQCSVQLNDLPSENIAWYHFILRPLQNNVDVQKDISDIDLDNAIKAFTRMIAICEPKVICFCGQVLLDMVESAFAKFNPSESLAELARRSGFSYFVIYNPNSFGLENDLSARGWFTNLISKNHDIHGKSKYKFISQAFDRAIENDDYTGLISVINEFKNEVKYKSDLEETTAPEKASSENRIKQSIEARRKRSEKLQNSAKNYWAQYTERSQELFEGTPVKVWPYIGNEYFSSEVKILSLGASHYKKARSDGSRPDLTPDSTIDVFLGSYQWNGWQFRNGTFAESVAYTAIPPYCRCYRKVASLISGDRSGASDFVNDHIAFMNYFQCVVGSAPKEFEENTWVTQEDYKDAERALFEGALPKLTPDIVIVWGPSIFKHIQGSNRKLTRAEYGNGNLWEYRLDLPNGTSKDILFFVINHPSSFGWDKHEAKAHWDVIRQHYPQIESICVHHPASTLVYDLYKKMRGKYKGLFLHFFSDCSYTMGLFPFENGVANGKSPRCMFAELVMNQDLEASIRFNTKDFKEDTCRKILEHPTWGVSKEVLESSFDGKFTLATFPADTPMEILEAKVQELAEKMLSYRQAVAW